ncbi:MAG: hypothetical protein ABFS45_23285 [Pseudomonadota bacterium]
MTAIKPRFEFRTFAQDFGIVARKMRAMSEVEKIRESAEIYIISRANDENNTKIRDQLMDIKVLVQEKEGLEQWNPRLKAAFPMKVESIRDEVFPAFGVAAPDFQREVYTLDQYLNEIIGPQPELQAVHVYKRRFAFTINGCIAELGDVYINGAMLRTANLESTDIAAIVYAKQEVNLKEYDNINYLMAIKRVIGMAPEPIPW